MSRPWCVVVVVVGLVLVVGCSARPAAEPGARPATRYGVLGSDCDRDRLPVLRSVGVEVAVTEVQWDRLEPEPGTVDRAYAAEVRDRVAACRAADLQVVLGLGMQNPPAWVLDLPAGRYQDRFGASPSDPAANLVFSAAVRDAGARYLRDVAGAVGLDQVEAVRLGVLGPGEFGYPDPAEGETSTYWAFDPAAQHGDGLAEGVAQSPLPGWAPGMGSAQGAPVTTEQVAQWYAWYTGSLTATLAWQAAVLRSAGFAGDLHVPVAGRGVLPEDLEVALAGGLDGRADPDGALSRGLDYSTQFPALAELDARLRTDGPDARVVLDVTGLDDDTATRTRATDAPEDTCHPGDTPESLRANGHDRGAAQRWTIALARAADLPVVGENPGPPDDAQTGGSPDSDDVAAQMVQAARYASECRLAAMYFAFEDELFAAGSGVDPGVYGRVISETRAGP